MANKKFVVELDEGERTRLDALVSKGKTSAKNILKARILLKADQGADGEAWTDEEICAALDTNVTMVTRVRQKLVEEGLDAVFTRKKRLTPPVQPIFDGEAEAKLIALACSKPPPGCWPNRRHSAAARWRITPPWFCCARARASPPATTCPGYDGCRRAWHPGSIAAASTAGSPSVPSRPAAPIHQTETR